MTKSKQGTFKTELLSVMSGIKNNPNNFPIIDKYNYKIFQKNKFQVFEIIERAVEQEFKDNNMEGE